MDGLTLDALSFEQDGGAATEVDIGRGELLQALERAAVVVVLGDSNNLRVEFAGREVILEQNAALEGLAPALELAMRLRAARRAAGV